MPNRKLEVNMGRRVWEKNVAQKKGIMWEKIK
jgi:hypothetical protein